MSSLLRGLAVLALAAASLVLLGAPAHACSCGATSLAQQTSAADRVFTGTVVDVTRSHDGRSFTYDVEVGEAFKGEVAPSVQVVTAASSATCGLGRLPLDRDYVFMVEPDAGREDVYVANLCAGSRPGTPALVRKVAAAVPDGAEGRIDDPDGDGGDDQQATPDTADGSAHDAGEPGNAGSTTRAGKAGDGSASDGDDDGIPAWPLMGGVLVVALVAGVWTARRTN